jgi:hypothetical protein
MMFIDGARNEHPHPTPFSQRVRAYAYTRSVPAPEVLQHRQRRLQ